MATVKGDKKLEKGEFEVYDVEFDDDDEAALRSDPVAFTKRLLGAHVVVNGMHLSAASSGPDGGQSRKLIHLVGPPGYVSNWVWVNVLLP